MALATVTTEAVEEIAPTTAEANGTVTDTGNGYYSKRGFVYGLASLGDPGNIAPSASGYDNYCEEKGTYDIQSFVIFLSGLLKNTQYFVRAWAYNASGYSYGNEVNFTTLARVYPDNIYSPRAKSNKQGVNYNPAKPTTVYAPDVTKLDDEVVAVETELGVNPKGAYASVAAFLSALLSAVGTIVTDFLGLSDTPASYVDQAGKVVAVNSLETGLEFITAGDGGNVGGLYGINIENLTGAKTLVPNTDVIFQYLNASGANRDVVLDTASAVAGDRFVIRSRTAFNAVHYLNIKQGAGVLDTIYSGGIKFYIFDGTEWRSNLIGTGDSGEENKNIAIGKGAICYNSGVAVGNVSNGNTSGVALGYGAVGNNNGVAVGAVADANTYGVAIGRNSLGHIYGVAVGYNAYGYNHGVAVGYLANSGNKSYSIALGEYSKCVRNGEMSINIDGITTQKNNNIIVGLVKSTVNATPVEMLAGAVAGARLTIRASSVLAFTGLVTCRNNTTGACGAWKIEGAIKRDAAGNTAMLTAATITLIAKDDAGFDIAVAADDTNEALVITVTGHATNTVQWVARVDGVETHF